MAGIFDPGIFDSGIFDTGAPGGVFTAKAVLKANRTGSFAANAVLKRTGQSGSFTADATFKPPPALPTLVQSGSGVGTVVLSAAPTPGNLMVVVESYSGAFNADAPLPSGYTLIARGTFAGGNFRDGLVAYRIAQPGDSATFTESSICRYLLMEWSGAVLDVIVSQQQQNCNSAGSPNNCGGSITPTAGRPCVIIGGTALVQGSNEPALLNMTPFSGVTEIGHSPSDYNGGNIPPVWAGYEKVFNPSGAYVIGATITAGDTRNILYFGCTITLVSSGSTFTADAVLAPSPTFTVAAVIKRNQTSSLTANAVLVKGFTARAVIKATRTGSATADAVLAARHFAANAVIKRTAQTGSFTADASTGRAFTANAVIKANVAGSAFTASAVKKKNQTGSFTADANIVFLRLGSFTANALVFGTQPGSFTISYATRQPNQPLPLIGVPTRIFVNGVDVTGHVKWATASFTAKVNSANGECSLDIVDRGHDLSFIFGDELTLYIDGILRWGGWVVQAVRNFPFDVVANPVTKPVTWHLAGVDYNRILDRRILHDTSHPNRTWNYPAGTYDNTILNDLWNFFDTTGFTKDFHRVNFGVLDIPGVTSKTGGNVAQGGFSLRDVLLHVSWDTGAIFFVTPQKVVTYVDADLISSPYTLTDQPSGPFDVGFHDVHILEDSTDMVNDSIVWGAGKGSASVVESRYQSAASQTAHGLWQAGNFTAGIYKQATADAVAQAQVEGSPASHRGAKNPKRAVTLLTWEPVFGVGDVVHFHDSQFFLPPANPGDSPTHNDILPIRTMIVTWPTPFEPLFELQLSWEIDAVWSFYDPWFPVGAPGSGTNVIPGGGQGTGQGGCSDAVCLQTIVFDDFEGRVEPSAWGVPTYGPDDEFGDGWFNSSNPSSVPSVSGGKGLATVSGSPSNFLQMDYQNLNKGDLPWAHDYTFSYTWMYDTAPTGVDYTQHFVTFIGNYTGIYVGLNLYITADPTDQSVFDIQKTSGNVIYNLPSNPPANTPINIKFQYGPGDALSAKVWWSGSEPDWQIVTGGAALGRGENKRISVNNDQTYAHVQSFDDFVFISDVCQVVQFEQYGRAVTNGWGSSNPSDYPWVIFLGASSLFAVNPGGGELNLTSNTSAGIAITDASGPWNQSDFSVRSSFILRDAPTTTKITNFGMLAGSVQIAGTDGPPITGTPKSYVQAGSPANTTFIPHGFWVAGGLYSIEITVSGGQATFTVAGSAASYSATGPFTPSSSFPVTAAANGSISTQKITILYIEIDFVDKPCYCAPTDFTVFNVVGLGQTFRVSVGSDGEASTSNVPPTYITVYNGATYRIEYSMFWGPTADVLEAEWCDGAGVSGPLATRVNMGSAVHGTQIFFAEITYTATADTIYGVRMNHVGTVGHSSLYSEVSMTVFWVSGPDPRFDTLPDCTPVLPLPTGLGLPAGTTLSEDLTPLGTASGAPPVYPSGSTWQTTNSILPGVATLLISGVYQYGNWVILDAAAGIIRIDMDVSAAATVSLDYITNGPL